MVGPSLLSRKVKRSDIDHEKGLSSSAFVITMVSLTQDSYPVPGHLINVIDDESESGTCVMQEEAPCRFEERGICMMAE